MEFGLIPTLGVLAFAIVLTVFCGWRGARLWDPRKGPRLMPWRFLMVMGAALTLLMVVHLLNLVGLPTGQNQPRYDVPR